MLRSPRFVEGAARVGLEAADVTWAQATAWSERLERELVATSGVVEALREVKDPGEIDRMRHAALIADTALGEVLHAAGAGTGSAPITEEAVRPGARRRRSDASAPSRSPSRRSWRPARTRRSPTTTPAPGSSASVIRWSLDFGATFEGYRSDMTRTFVVGGEPSGELATIFDVVKRAQAAGIAACDPASPAARSTLAAGISSPRPAMGSASSTRRDTAWASTSTRPRGWRRRGRLSWSPASS